MKLFKSLFALALLAIAMTSSSAWADRYYHGGYHGGPRVGVVVGIGGPGYYRYPDPYFYGPYPYAYPPVVVAPAEPPVYIQQAPAQDMQPQPSNDWFYCRKPEGYYPYVKQCPGGWQRVAPQPPPQP
jgi:hypothetical protein